MILLIKRMLKSCRDDRYGKQFQSVTMSDLSMNCPRKILGNICTEKTEYMYVAIEKCSELCEYVRIKKRKLAKALKEEK